MFQGLLYPFAYKSALELKKANPDMDVFILYRDIRTYGQREAIYSEARAAGVIFIRYSLDEKPEVVAEDDGLLVKVKDHILQQVLEIRTDLLTLAGAIVPEENETLAGFYKLPLTEDGFFAEQHVKLGPSQFAIDGMFLCGMAHYPKSIDESIAQGQGRCLQSHYPAGPGEDFLQWGSGQGESGLLQQFAGPA